MEKNFSEPKEQEAAPSEENIDSFSKPIYSLLMQATRAANSIPSEEDFKFYATSRPFKKKMDQCGERVLGLLSKFMEATDNNRSNFKSLDDVNDRFDAVVDVTDALLEKVDTYLDELSGKKVAPAPLPTAPVATKSAKAVAKTSNILRPQNKFMDEIDNSNRPFVPKLSSKPNALVSLEESLSAEYGLMPNGEFVSAPHPYQAELDRLQYLPHQLKACKEQLYAPLDSTPCEWIDTEEKLQGLVAHLSAATEFAVDLEHHSYRSFQGFLCLMQISTRTHDFIVDTIELRKSLHVLNTVFSNPKIVKVLHGADSDIIWLQRDFGIYIVNMFDTGQASRVLEFPSASLAYLLKHFCSIAADKKYQLADWRIRPLTAEMLKYAREDTHYLLYVYDRLRNLLLEKSNESGNLMRATLQRSRDVCLRRYEKELFREEEYMEVLAKAGAGLVPRQQAVFRAVYKWRDIVSRVEDESKIFVLPQHTLFSIAEGMPTDAAKLEACCTPMPHFVRKNLRKLLSIILFAAEGNAKVNELIDSFDPLSKAGMAGTKTNETAKPVATVTTTQTQQKPKAATAKSDSKRSKAQTMDVEEDDGEIGLISKTTLKRKAVCITATRSALFAFSSEEDSSADEEDHAKVARIHGTLTSASSVFQSLMPKAIAAIKESLAQQQQQQQEEPMLEQAPDVDLNLNVTNDEEDQEPEAEGGDSKDTTTKSDRDIPQEVLDADVMQFDKEPRSVGEKFQLANKPKKNKKKAKKTPEGQSQEKPEEPEKPATQSRPISSGEIFNPFATIDTSGGIGKKKQAGSSKSMTFGGRAGR